MANSITNRQMFYVLIMTLTTYTSIDLPKLVAEKAGRSGWLLVLAVAFLFGVAAILVTKLNNRFPGMVLYDYSREIAGRFVSLVIIIYYILYFLTVGVYLKVKLVDFLSASFLPKTPQFLMLLIAVALFAYVSYKGVTNVARVLELFGIVFLVTTITICVIMLFQGMIYNIRPFWNPNEVKFFPGTVPYLFFPFGGVEVLLIVPFTKRNRKAPLVSFLTMLFIGLFYALIIEGTICILGINNTILYNDSLIEAIKIVYIPIIERTDIFYLTVGLSGLFAGMIMVFLSILEFICRLFARANRAVVTLAVAVVLYVLCLVGLGIPNITDTLNEIAPYLVVASSFVIPALLLLVAVIRKKRAAGRTEDDA